jgi:hypothetical protein
MFGLIRGIKFATALAAALVIAGASSHAQAGTGTVHLKIVKAGFIVGGGGGSGTLTFNGQNYHLKIGGIGVGTIGIAETRLYGTAYHLNSPQDIAGTYASAGAGLAIGGGANVITLQNEKGVVLQLKGTQVGFQATLGLGGLNISLH